MTLSRRHNPTQDLHWSHGKDGFMGKYVTHKGGCHCGDVVFEVAAPARLRVQECNCSICRMTGFLHLIVPASCFRADEGR